MVYKKKTLPEEDEIVLCTVKKILHNSIFAILDEYENLEGMIHISEIAAGRIRNIRDYVKEGKTIVCKVLRVKTDRRQIDLSLRRVSNVTKVNKLKEYKQEIRAEKLLERLGKKFKLTLKELYEKAGNQIKENYDTLYQGFLEILKKDEKVLLDLKIDKKLAAELTKLVKENIKIPEISLKSTIKIQDYSEKGVENIKKAFKNTIKLTKDKNYKAKFIYISAPNYSIEIKASDYKTGEKILKEISDNLVKEIENLGGTAEWQKAS